MQIQLSDKRGSKMGRLIEDVGLRNVMDAFEDRSDAGKSLAAELLGYRGTDSIILAIPSGGVPVAAEIADIVDLPVDLVIARKLQIPYNPEAGFGAVTPDGKVILNRELVNQLKLSQADISRQVQKTMQLITKRNQLFRNGRPFSDIRGKQVILVDDGLASGYTMMAAIRFAKNSGAERVTVAVPTCSKKTLDFVLRETDEMVCLNVRTGFTFAVADAYTNWYDLDDDEVLSFLEDEHFLAWSSDNSLT
jgi:putative phosphoribosyl transferase